MTADFSQRTDGQAAGPMLTPLSADQFAAACRALTEQFSGDELHRRMDWLASDLLCNLGYGEGVAAFLAHAMPYHCAPALNDEVM